MDQRAVEISRPIRSTGGDLYAPADFFEKDAEDYVHRIGRTGRAGTLGTAVSIACDDYVISLDSIQKLIGREIAVEWAPEELLERGHAAKAPQPERARERRGHPRRRAAESRSVRRAEAPSARPGGDPSPVTYGREKRKSRRR